MNIFNLINRKTILNKQVEKIVREAKSIYWFCNCGKEYKQQSYFHYIQECDDELVIKRLNQNTNSKDFTTLENLLSQADSRLNWYLYRHHEKNIKHWQVEN